MKNIPQFTILKNSGGLGGDPDPFKPTHDEPTLSVSRRGSEVKLNMPPITQSVNDVSNWEYAIVNAEDMEDVSNLFKVLFKVPSNSSQIEK